MKTQTNSIFDFMSMQLFLQSFYDEQKKINSDFSYMTWSETLGFKNKTILRMILQGKRTLTKNSILLFCTYFQFNELESQYFETLAFYNQAKNENQKQAFGSLLIKLQRKNTKQNLFTADSGILEDVYGPIILTIINSAEKSLSFLDIQSHSGISGIHLKNILDTLLKSDLISINSENYYVPQISTFKIKDDFKNINLKKYYEFWFDRSSRAMNLPSDTRRFRSLQIALTPEEFQDIALQTNEFAATLLSKVQNNTIENRNLYLLNTALFPVKEITV